MEAKDTVMSPEQLEQVEEDYIDEDFSVNSIGLGRGHTEDLKLRVAQAQAEITFPLGKKDGIKEVLSFLHDGSLCEHKIARKKCAICWQALLKKWELEDYQWTS